MKGEGYLWNANNKIIEAISINFLKKRKKKRVVYKFQINIVIH